MLPPQQLDDRMVFAIDDPIPERNPEKLAEGEVGEDRVRQAVPRNTDFIRAEAHIRHD